ncbi:MAG: RsmB/NOP family class I SAM-dependent RNA methyltransferase [Leptospiraceae bacterium]|nr:RsmB/NOP family class I SAM-dependent RNA methyltransferase [Leptospiraceae bacterium]MDW8305982.1 RsmB/NOP family class I SAM-dependent RNA methyltransferase [Leptospiraceae bacterium]
MPQDVGKSRLFHFHKLWKSLCDQKELPPVDRFLTEYFRKNKQYGRRDRREYADLLYTVFRRGIYLAHRYLSGKSQAFAKSSPSLPHDPPAVWRLLRHIPYEDLWEYLHESLETYALKSPFLSMVHPSYEAYFKKRAHFSNWGEDSQQKFFLFLNKRPPLWLRLNYPEKKALVLHELRSLSLKAQEYDLPDITAIRVEGERGIYELRSYREGLFEIQDLASQWIGAQVQARPGMFVWDACAGGGGKTLLLASVMQNKGVIYASDIREFKLRHTKLRARRAQFSNIRYVGWDGSNLPLFPREVDRHGGFDRVLVDAPCSASGTWRRNPDAMYRFSLGKLPELLDLQRKLILKASCAVRPGGLLVYATCSWLVEENEEIAQFFIQEAKDFSMVSQDIYGFPYHDCDLMYAAVFRKVK